jgi:hypothetical protein
VGTEEERFGRKRSCPNLGDTWQLNRENSLQDRLRAHRDADRTPTKYKSVVETLVLLCLQWAL